MHKNAEMLVAIGGILLLGLATDFLGRRTRLPRVTLLLLLGIAVGEQGLDLLPGSVVGSFEVITEIVLMMVGFLLGGKLTLSALKGSRRQLVSISLCAALGTTVLVALCLSSLGVPRDIAILLGCIASATAPAATIDTVLESAQDNRFSRLLLAIVAIDDAWALILFSLGLGLVSLLNGVQGYAASLLDAVYHIGGALLLGGLIGLPAAYLTGRVRPGKPMLTEALGLVSSCGGLAVWLDLSFLLATMAMGMVIANLARHHDYPFHEIENVESPLMVVFFVLAGASLEIGMLREVGLIGSVYLLARVFGKISGAWLGARVSGAGTVVRRWMGLALLPQAGVAIGMALLAAAQYPQHSQIILSTVIATSVLFEIVGPVCTRIALERSQIA